MAQYCGELAYGEPTRGELARGGILSAHVFCEDCVRRLGTPEPPRLGLFTSLRPAPCPMCRRAPVRAGVVALADAVRTAAGIHPEWPGYAMCRMCGAVYGTAEPPRLAGECALPEALEFPRLTCRGCIAAESGLDRDDVLETYRSSNTRTCRVMPCCGLLFEHRDACFEMVCDCPRQTVVCWHCGLTAEDLGGVYQHLREVETAYRLAARCLGIDPRLRNGSWIGAPFRLPVIRGASGFVADCDLPLPQLMTVEAAGRIGARSPPPGAPP